MKKKNRPEPFFLHMEQLLGTVEAGLLIEALKSLSCKSVRYNANLCSLHQLQGTPVPWCPDYGRYWDTTISPSLPSLPSRTMDYTAGKYYIQEASAMLAIAAAALVIDFKGKRVLDLCAAPGGKTTQAAELLGSGFMVANEVKRDRLDALIWNINRHRLHNVLVTSLATDFLAQLLPGYFDIVIVDAPCSGEGLFQKRKNSTQTWSANNVRMCARRQHGILTDAQRLLSPGGYLVYSTCTFSQEENEAQILSLMQQGFGPVTLPGPQILPVSPAITTHEAVASCSRRIFPHRHKGAGAFLSILQNQGQSVSSPDLSPIQAIQGKSTALVSTLFPFLLFPEVQGYLYDKNGIISYFSHPTIPESLAQHVFQIGAPLLDKRRDNEPMFGCTQFPAPAAILPLELPQAEAYIQGQELQLISPDGYYFVSYQNMVLGPVKIKGQRAENKLPRPLQTLL